MNSKYCELNRPHSTDCRICDIFISLIYSYYHKKNKNKQILLGRGVLGVWWVIYGFFGGFFL